MFNLENVFGKKAKKAMMTKEEIAEFIKTNPEALRSFEESYTKHVKNKVSNNFFAVNAKQAVSEKCFLSDLAAENVHLDALVQRIVAELLDSAQSMSGTERMIMCRLLIPFRKTMSRSVMRI